MASISTLWLAALTMIGGMAFDGPGLAVEPARVAIRGSDGRAQLAVTSRGLAGLPLDRTASSQYASLDPRVAVIDAEGLVRPVGDGSTKVEVEADGQRVTVDVVVTDFADVRAVHFVGEVVPILTKAGCNSGGCHGKSTGQNGFRLSLLGFDPKADHEALVREGRGRRVFPPSPAASLLLRKPTASVPHGGGQKFKVDSPEYRTLARWIAQGTSLGGGPDEPALVALAVEPAKRVVPARGRQQLRVVARYSDGTSADVTRLTQFQSNALDLAEVDDRGVVRTLGGVGEAAVMARFGGLVGVARATIPAEVEPPPWVEPPSKNPLDRFVFAKLRELRLAPSPNCTDAEFARRSSLDVCGLLPRPAEVAAFETDADPEKRAKWVDRLVDLPESADFFAMKWSAILKNKRTLGDLSKPGTFAFHGWIRQAMAENRPYDRFVAEIVAARGDANVNPAVEWSRQSMDVEDRADDVAQLFLGQRIQCARCHHHPFEKWSQDDYYGFASIFARIGVKEGPGGMSPGVFTHPTGLATNPVTGEVKRPKPLGAAELPDFGPTRDPRDELAKWLIRADNPFFAKALVNRYWKHFLGRGLVEPEDDLRATNPPSNPELLDALADDFIRNGYDLKRLVRSIATSRAYDRSSVPLPSNEADRRNFARFAARRLPAEVLLDAIGVLTGSPENFIDLPEGARATQLPDDGFGSYFLDVFGRPKRENVCECERSSEANLAQSLHLLNSDEIQARLTPDSARAAKLATDPRSDAEKVEELYRLAFARRPTDAERGECVAFLTRRASANSIRSGYEDLIWTLINTKEFLFNQ